MQGDGYALPRLLKKGSIFAFLRKQGDWLVMHKRHLFKSGRSKPLPYVKFARLYKTRHLFSRRLPLPRDISLTLNMTKQKVIFSLKRRVYHKKQAMLAASAKYYAHH